MKFFVYSKNGCPHCVTAVGRIRTFQESVPDNHGELLDVFYVDADESKKEELFKTLEGLGYPKPRTVPQIFFKEDDESELHYVGEGSDLPQFLSYLRKKLGLKEES